MRRIVAVILADCPWAGGRNDDHSAALLNASTPPSAAAQRSFRIRNRPYRRRSDAGLKSAPGPCRAIIDHGGLPMKPRKAIAISRAEPRAILRRYLRGSVFILFGFAALGLLLAALS